MFSHHPHPDSLFLSSFSEFTNLPWPHLCNPYGGPSAAGFEPHASKLLKFIRLKHLKRGPYWVVLKRTHQSALEPRGPPILPSRSRPTKLPNSPKTSGQTFESRACQRHPPSANCRQYLVCGVTHPCVVESPHRPSGLKNLRVTKRHNFGRSAESRFAFRRFLSVGSWRLFGFLVGATDGQTADGAKSSGNGRTVWLV